MSQFKSGQGGGQHKPDLPMNGLDLLSNPEYMSA